MMSEEQVKKRLENLRSVERDLRADLQQVTAIIRNVEDILRGDK